MKNLIAILIVLIFTTSLCASSLVIFSEHNIDMTIDVQNHKASFTDNGKLEISEGDNIFKLSNTAVISELNINNKLTNFQSYLISDSLKFHEDTKMQFSDIEFNDNSAIILFNSESAGEFNFSISYDAEFMQDVSMMRFSRERVGGEVTGTILEKGAYLSPSSYYYPMGDEDILSFYLTANIPLDWESISDGNCLESIIEDGRKIQKWHNPFLSDGLMFMAAPYVVKSMMADSIEVYCYFFPEDTSLFDKYLTATTGYVKMYSDLIGPYPFERFTVAENFFPTGYGMPGWTLLGQRVINLPFILTSSLGHEILHNWFGNSLYVDYETGNWCEPITVYGADYTYKLMKSEIDAKNYRKNILKSYNSYVNENNDFPIRDFKSRTSPNTRTIGYSKAMMVVHLIHRIIGDDAFYKSWRDMYSEYRGTQISWEDWMNMYDKNSDKDISFIIPQWIDRVGAPEISLQIGQIADNIETNEIMFTLSQNPENIYNLQIPIRFSNDNEYYDTTVTLSKETEQYIINIPTGYKTITVDPDFHIFRKLYPEEIEPIVSGVLGVDDFIFMTDEKDGKNLGLFKEFGINISGDSVNVLNMSQLTNKKYEQALVNLNPNFIPDYYKGQFEVTDSAYIVKGKSYPKEGKTIILSGQNSDMFDKYLLVITDDYESLPRLGQLIPHYGKYSYLVFDKAKNIDKGQWDVNESPLSKLIRE